MMTLAKAATRLLAFLGKELVEVTRRPGALLSLILGPFLILAIFGAGYSGYRRPLDTLVAIPPQTGLPTDTASYENVPGPGIHVVAVIPDPAEAERRLRSGEVDVVIVAPADAEQRLRAGEQSVIQVIVDVADPLEANYALLLAQQLSDHVNQELIRRVVDEAQAEAGAQGLEFQKIPPEVVAAPTRAEVTNIAPAQPNVVGFFGPAVLALILQHMAVTLIALSVVRERTTGIIELFRISPVSAWEVVAGKILGFGALSAAIAAVSFALLVYGLDVPLLGSLLLLGSVVGLLILASLGLGMLIALISDSERQTVQLSLLALLGSIFFSGFVLPLTEFAEPVQAAARVIPVTNGISLIQDVMLRGTVRETWQAGVLGVTGVVLLAMCWLLLRRGMSKA
jgi:ABC-2 type transport system permease protein